MRSKASSEYLLRALDGEQLQLGADLRDLFQLGSRLSCALPAIPPLPEDARRRIWKGVVSGSGTAAAGERRVTRVPRLAWGIAAGVALALIVVLVLVFVNIGGGPVVEPGEIARLQLVEGEVRVISQAGEERAAREGELLRDGDSLIGAEDARAVAEFDGGSMMRLDGETEVSFSAVDGEVISDITRGRSYNRVIDGSSYMVRSGRVEVTARGTAFTFDVAENAGRVMSLQSSVELEVFSEDVVDWRSSLEEGQEFIYGEGEGEADISEIPLDDLDNEWLRWNKDQDENLGLPLGVLSQLDGGDSVDGQTPAQDEATTPPEDQPAPQPSPTPQPSPSPQPTPAPQPVEKSIVLSAQAGTGTVSFSWTVAGYSGFQGFKLCRSETNPAPSYPGDWWQYVDGEGARSTSDSTVQAGHTYYYRIGVYNQGSILGYSNAVQVTVPGQPQELSITLSATLEGGKVKLNWQVSGDGSYDGFKVCRSETNPSPGYPADALTLVSAGVYSYADSGVVSGHTYYYRVGIYKSGSILKYSNAVQIAVP